VKDGFCTTHHPTEGQDMRELGKKGGPVRLRTKLRQAADDELREQARDVLARALRGEEVSNPALDSARSLFSYRSDAPPSGRHGPDGKYDGPRLVDGRRPMNLADVLRAAIELNYPEQDPALVEVCREIVSAADAEADVDGRQRYSATVS
jgi:hypothetical protein